MTIAYCDPNSDVTYTWADDGANDYADIDDAVRSPTNAKTEGDGNYLDAGPTDDLEEAVFGMTEPIELGTVTQIVLYMHAENGSAALNVDIRVKLNGSWQAAGTVNVSGVGWYTKTYTGSWNALTDLWPMQIGIKTPTMGKSDDLFVYAAYVELTYTTGGTTHERQTGDLLAASQSFAVSSIAIRFISDAISVSDIFLHLVHQVLGRLIQEPFGVGFILTRAAELQRLVSEPAALSDLPRLGAHLFRVIGDSIGGIDTSIAQSITARMFFDALELCDWPACEAIWRRSLLDATGLDSTASRNVNILRSAVDSMILSEDVVRVVDALRALTNFMEAGNESANRRVLGNVLPGDTTFASRGPGDAAIQPQGPGRSHQISRGPGDATVEAKTSGD